MLHALHEFTQLLDLLRRQVFAFALDVAVEKIDPFTWHVPEIDHSCPTPLPSPLRGPTKLTEPSAAADKFTSVRGRKQIILQSTKIFIDPVLKTEIDERSKFDEDHFCTIRCERIDRKHPGW